MATAQNILRNFQFCGDDKWIIEDNQVKYGTEIDRSYTPRVKYFKATITNLVTMGNLKLVLQI
jgi:hypothetical protein